MRFYILHQEGRHHALNNLLTHVNVSGSQFPCWPEMDSDELTLEQVLSQECKLRHIWLNTLVESAMLYSNYNTHSF